MLENFATINKNVPIDEQVRRGVHTNHADYEKAIQEHLDERWTELMALHKNETKAAKAMHTEIEQLGKAIKAELIEKSVKGQMNVNDLFKDIKVTDLIPNNN